MNPNYTWRSIMEAQDLVRTGIRQNIGDGASTKVWQISWLPCAEYGCLTTSMSDELRETTVQMLMNEEQNRWDYDVINNICNVRDRELITRIPIPIRHKEDS